MSTSPASRKRWSRPLIVIVIAAVLLLLVLLVLISASGPEGFGSPPFVSVSGTASIAGIGAKYPTMIKFILDGSQKSYNATVESGGQKSGNYTVTLPNGKTFHVEISYGGPLGLLGSCNAGNLTIRQGPGKGSMTRNFGC